MAHGVMGYKNRKNRMRIVVKRIGFVLLGAAFGLLVVRGFFLDPTEEIGWRIFWDALFRGHIGMRGIREVVGSATFAKSMLGVGVGAVVGYFSSKNVKVGRRR